MTLPGWLTRDRITVLLAVVAPFAVALLLVPFRRGKVVDVERHGLPTDTEIELLVESNGLL